MQSNLKNYFELMRFHKPIGIFLLLWPTWWALLLASHGIPSFKNFIIFTLGVIVMRAAGCVINDYADRDFDLHVTRTRSRPITSGKVSSKNALILFIILCLIGFILVLFTNFFTICLSFLALLTATIYPFMKRHTHWPQFILGVAFSFSIPMAFTAQINALPSITFLLMLANIFWTIAYDTEYALVDREDDLRIGVKSTAILFGKYNRLIIGLFQTMALLLLCFIGIYLKLNWVYFLGLFSASLLFIYQQKLLSTQQTQNYFQAFLNNHWVGCAIFMGILFSI